MATGPHLLPVRRDREWSMACLAAANWTTALGAACFFAGALMLLPQEV